MRLSSSLESQPRGIAGAIPLGAIVAAFSATLFLSALLLFAVQPLFARMVLPRLGGAPAVWAVTMCFFQAVLLAGYCYAYLIERTLRPRLVPAVHMAVLLLAALALPIAVPATWSEPPPGDAYLWLIGLLCVGVGVPFFAVSANAPLLQAWFARTNHPDARDPYFLYGASNAGSLLALIAYPVLAEPLLGVVAQARLWSWGYALLCLAIAVCALLLLSVPATRNDEAPVVHEPSPGWRRRFQWVALAAVPSGLLVAYTSFLTTDIASAPFLWVLPLAAFLATFILTFRETPTFSHATLMRFQPLLVAGVLLGLSTVGGSGWMLAACAGTGAFLVTTLVAHRELYERRPGSTRLTEFYLLMSLGGVLGGVFAALIAPQIFASIWEFPLLLIAGLACRRELFRSQSLQHRISLLMLVVSGFLVLAGLQKLAAAGLVPRQELLRIFLILACTAVAMHRAQRTLQQLCLMTIAALSIVLLPSALNRGDAERSFFGVHRIVVLEGNVRALLHGTTIHGAERITPDDASASARPLPMAYYYPNGPLARGSMIARKLAEQTKRKGAFGVVGLGAGAMACLAHAGEQWRFFEIDPVVLRIARDPRLFTYMTRCQPDAEVVLGDARLTLAKDKGARFDYLVIDAFASDAVPVHLMTREAIALYLDRLTPGGILAMHVSNRHLDLQAVAVATAKSLPGTHVALAVDSIPAHSLEAAPSNVVFVTRSAETAAALDVLPYLYDVVGPQIAPWTDDFANVLAALWRKQSWLRFPQVLSR